MLYLIIAQDIKPLLSQALIVREKFTDHNDAILMKLSFSLNLILSCSAHVLFNDKIM